MGRSRAGSRRITGPSASADPDTPARRNRRQNILNRDPPTLARPTYRRRLEPILRQQTPHRRTQPTRSGTILCNRLASRRYNTRTRRAHSRHRSSSRPGSSDIRIGLGRRSTNRLNPPQHLPRLDLLLLPLDDLTQNPCAGRGDLHGNLIRLDLDERLVLGDRLADILEPTQHLRARALGLLGRSSDFHRGSHEYQTLASC